MIVPNEPGDYVVTIRQGFDDTPAVTHTFEGVHFEYSPEGHLQVMRGFTLVATFQYWDSIVATDA